MLAAKGRRGIQEALTENKMVAVERFDISHGMILWHDEPVVLTCWTYILDGNQIIILKLPH